MKRLLFPLLLIAVLFQATVMAQPPYVRNILDTNAVTLGAGLSLSAGNVLSSSGGGTPGGVVGNLQVNGTGGTFAGSTNVWLNVTNGFLGIGTANPLFGLDMVGFGTNIIRQVQGVATQEVAVASIGMLSDNAFDIKVNNAVRWRFNTLGLGYSFEPQGSNIYDVASRTFPAKTNYANDFVAIETVSTPVLNLTGTSSGNASFYDAAGTEYSQFLAPPNIQTNNVSVLWSNATAGVVVAQPAGVGTNQLQNVALTAGQYVTYNGTAYVASNLPAAGGSSLPSPQMQAPLLSDGTNAYWGHMTNGYFLQNEFMFNPSATLFGEQFPMLATTSSGTVAVDNAVLATNRFGVVKIMSGTASGNNASIYCAYTGGGDTGGILLGNCWYEVGIYARLTAIPTNAADGAQVLIGVGENGFPADGLTFMTSTNNPYWRIVTGSGFSYTTNSSTTLTDTAWHWFVVQCNPAATSVAFLIDGVEVANSPMTTTIPAARFINGPAVYVGKVGGATSLGVYVDKVYQAIKYKVPMVNP